MAWTVSSFTFRCPLEVAERVAEEAGLKQEMGQNKWDRCHMWWDWATLGGGCRLVWSKGIVWVSRHSGYPQADCTEEVAFFLEHYGAEPIADDLMHMRKNLYLYPDG